MERTEGLVETRSTYGVKINGEWYNEDKNHKGVLQNIKKGDRVIIEYVTNGKWKNAISAKNDDDKSNDTEKQESNNKEDDHANKRNIVNNAQKATIGPTIGMAINNAAEYVLKFGDAKGKPLPPETWASEVISYAQALLAEMNANGL